MSNLEPAADLQQSPCHVCQSVTFAWGRLNTTGVTQFLPRDQSMMDRFMSRGATLSARLCEACGNVQLFRTQDDEG